MQKILAAETWSVQPSGRADTRVFTSSKELFQLIRCAEAASDHIPNQTLRTQLMQTVYAARELILDPSRSHSHSHSHSHSQVRRA